jgi:hypothetical protein
LPRNALKAWVALLVSEVVLEVGSVVPSLVALLVVPLLLPLLLTPMLANALAIAPRNPPPSAGRSGGALAALTVLSALLVLLNLLNWLTKPIAVLPDVKALMLMDFLCWLKANGRGLARAIDALRRVRAKSGPVQAGMA